MLNLITPVNDVFRRSYDVADTDLLDPTETDALEQGEWLALNTSGSVERADGTSLAMFQMFTERGDGGAQALGRCTLMQLHDYEAETDMFDSTKTYVIGDPLKVASVSIDGVTRSVLTNHSVADGTIVVGFVTQDPAANADDMLRYQKQTPYTYEAA